jgi:hypothetical protein
MIFAFLGGLAFSAKRTNRFEGFTVFKPPALAAVSDFSIIRVVRVEPLTPRNLQG